MPAAGPSAVACRVVAGQHGDLQPSRLDQRLDDGGGFGAAVRHERAIAPIVMPSRSTTTTVAPRLQPIVAAVSDPVGTNPGLPTRRADHSPLPLMP